ncbi:MAG: winged helix-turn-helix transcriptional regulator [Anaerolineae bacterium]
MLRENPRLAIPDLAASIGKSESAVERAIRRLREENRLRRMGSAKGGHWEVAE